ncbi:hypothetical protein [Staphylococcus sp. HMSC072E01]|uniref:hypothetical protein n=1 Tax=Staphylococcus sp. HMSC072E01 TaxID=1739457 RepID=UPI00210F0B0B|nr:hypothetical protein [Staphylococcus sp. HMSC072E01]
MLQNIFGVLTILKIFEIPLNTVLDTLVNYKPNKGAQNLETYTTLNHINFIVIDNSWNVTAKSMIEGIRALENKSRFYKGKTIAVLGQLMDLERDDIQRQHENIAKTLIHHHVDLVFGYGKDINILLNNCQNI